MKMGECKKCGHGCHCSNGGSCCGGQCECSDCQCKKEESWVIETIIPKLLTLEKKLVE